MFTIRKDGQSDTIHYDEANNLLFAELYSSNQMWIRLAQNKASNGESGPHIDIDICNFSGTGVYRIMDPQQRPCDDDAGPIWDIWWHTEGEIYANTLDSTPSELRLEVRENRLYGRFYAQKVKKFKGTSEIGIVDGVFESAIVRK